VRPRDGHVRLMQSVADTTSRGSVAFSTDALELLVLEMLVHNCCTSV